MSFQRPPMSQEEIVDGFKSIATTRAALAALREQQQKLVNDIRDVESRLSTFERVTEIFEGVPLHIYQPDTDWPSFSHVEEGVGRHRLANVWRNARNPELWGFETGHSGTYTDMGSRTTFHGSGWPDKESVIRACKVWVAHGRLEMPIGPERRW